MLVVARTPTPVAQAALPGLIDAAFAAENAPLRGIQRMMLAVLSAIETARGGATKNHNIGNITAGNDYPGMVWRPPWFDPAEAAGSPQLERLHREMKAGRAPSAFRAYATREEGARDFARQLRFSFPEVLRAALVPNAENFRLALAQKYSRDYADPRATTTLERLMREFSITPAAASATSGLFVSAVLLWLAWRYVR